MPLDDLLKVQAHDTAIEQLRHRRSSLSEREQLTDLAAQRAGIDVELTTLAAERDELARDQRRLEDKVAMVEAKVDAEQAKLYGGSVTSPKEAQALQDEIDSLKRHQGTLEDRILVLMEAIEPLTGSIDGFESTIAGIDERRTEVQSSLDSQESELDEGLGTEEQQRAEAAAALSPDLLGRYEAARGAFGPSTVVEFDGKNCVGCPLSMPAVEIDRVKKSEPGTLVDCQECGRLVVR